LDTGHIGKVILGGWHWKLGAGLAVQPRPDIRLSNTTGMWS
jgi:hypothetical protein